MTTSSLQALLTLVQNPQWRRMLSDIQQAAEDSASAVYLVGGVLRDALLGLETTISDVDITVEGDAIALATVLAERWKGKVRSYPDFRTARVIPGIPLPGDMKEVDFASTRTERYPVPGGKPEVTPATIKEDLYRRDFTINGLALSLKALLTETSGSALMQHVQDTGQGMDDLNNRCVRIYHENSFHDDPTRLLRALRYRTLIDGTLSDDTRVALKARLAEGVFPAVNAQRFAQEFQKTIRAMPLSVFCQAWIDLGFVDYLPLFSRDLGAQVVRFADVLDKNILPARWKEQAFLCACYHWYAQQESALFASMTGTAKKQCRRWIQDVTNPIEHCTTASILAVVAAEGSLPLQGLPPGEYTDELEKRYQVYEQQERA